MEIFQEVENQNILPEVTVDPLPLLALGATIGIVSLIVPIRRKINTAIGVGLWGIGNSLKNKDKGTENIKNVH